MRIVGYARVSTGKQVEKGVSLPDQEKGIRAWCKTHRHTLVAVCSDEGISGGKDQAERDGLAEALRMISDGEADALVVKNLDRFARALTVQEATLAMIWRDGGRVFAFENGEILPDDPDDPMRTAMRQMMGVFAELERRMIAKRLRDGRRIKLERGGFAYGSPAYGTRAVDRELTVDETEQAGIDRIAELHRQGRSLREIVSALTAEGIRPKRGGTWYPITVKRIIDRLPERAA
jgi:DNA invertase Pin-like site-specific DNA recombinase